MLNETASSTDDRPMLRPSVRHAPNENNAAREEIRRIVMSVLMIERETFNIDESAAGENMAILGGNAYLIATFEGRLTIESEVAYEQIDRAFAPLNYVPLFREANGKHVIRVIGGRARPQARGRLLNLILFIATLFSVLLVGTEMAINEIYASNPAGALALLNNLPLELWRGLPYAISILLILGAHEFGHYFAARRHRLVVTLPYFIPLPFISPIGTMGAFIQLREPMRNRKVLLDVGAAGPLAGLIVALPILFIGLMTAQVGPITPGGTVEGNSVLYALAKIIVFGRFLPDGAVDVYVNQMAWAGWTGLLVTGLNLLPLGQLDGGHILFSLIGDHARKLYVPILALLILLTLFVTEAWVLWLFLLLLFGRYYAAPLDMITPLDKRRRWIAVFSLAVFFLTFVPVPFTIAEAANSPALPRDSVLLPLAIGLIALWARRRAR